MNKKQQKKFFPSQLATEEVFLLLRRHWFSYVIFGIFLVVLIIPFIIFLIYFINNFSDISSVYKEIYIVLMSIYFLSVLGILLFGFVDYYLDVYIVTDRRIIDIKQNGFFKRDISEVNMRQVQDVKAKVNGVFSTIFHFGEVYIQTAGERENFIFQSVPHPYTVSKKIIDLHEKYLEEIDGNEDNPKPVNNNEKLNEYREDDE